MGSYGYQVGNLVISYVFYSDLQNMLWPKMIRVLFVMDYFNEKYKTENLFCFFSPVFGYRWIELVLDWKNPI